MDDIEQPQQPVEQDYQGDLAQTLSQLQLAPGSASNIPAALPTRAGLPPIEDTNQARQIARGAAVEAVEVLIGLMRNERAPAAVRRQSAVGILEYADSPEPARREKPLGQMTADELRELRDKQREQERVIDGVVEVVSDGKSPEESRQGRDAAPL